MKELSIEEKAYNDNYKVYTELINRLEDVKNAIKKQNYGIAMDILCKPYPEFQITKSTELKESEDERIRKSLIILLQHFCKGYRVSGLDFPVSYKDMLAWLEKQCEQKCAEWHREDEQNLNACLGYIPDEFLRRWLTDIIHVKYDKPSDKAKPKSKAGDWVVCNNGPHHIFQVIERSWPNAKYRDIKGTEIFLNVFTLDKQYHLWTIQDAKDGDVLCSEQIILLFKKWKYNNDWNCAIAYVGIDMTGKLQITNEHWLVSNYVHPAVKEQRDLLFQKMKEAGYEWDAEKKELKKIVAPIFHIGDRVRYKGHACDGVITEITSTDYICGNAKLPISTQDNLEIVEQKQEWSEEDEKNYDSLLKIICASNKSEKLVNKLYDWFKSLKDRVQPQNSIVTDEELAQAKKDAYNDILDKIEYDSEIPTFEAGWDAAIWYLKKRIIQAKNK